MADNTVHVVPFGDEWIVKEEGHIVSRHRTQAEAERFARDEAQRVRGEMVVHGRDGRIERKNSYGDDLRSVRG